MPRADIHPAEIGTVEKRRKVERNPVQPISYYNPIINN